MVEPQRPQALWRLRVAYWISKTRRAQANARSRAPTPIRALAPAHIHRRTIYVTLTAFARQQWVRERASLLRSTYITSFLSSIRFCYQHRNM